MRQSARKVLPTRSQWHHIGEFTISEADQIAFRDLRARDAMASNICSQYLDKKPAVPSWKHWENTIHHKDLVKSLHNFYNEQKRIFDNLEKEDHEQAVMDQEDGWHLYDKAVSSCQKSIEHSENIVKNGARALYISFNNPPISHATQSEWIDTDQYWQAFVEKHMYHANYLNILAEDPESKESVAAIETEALKRWEIWDGRGVDRHNNKRLYQRPSYEYYDLYRGPLVEHMIFYLAKTGGDARMFPELLPHQWFSEIYNNRFEVYNVLQRRKRKAQEKGLLRTLSHDLCPTSLEEEGEAYYEQWIKRESALMELCVARLMGNFIYLSETVPIQSESALLRALAVDGGAGKIWFLGDDVNCLFYEPVNVVEDEVDPRDAFHSYMDHMRLSGYRFTPAYSQILEIFFRTLESRKAGMNGRWFSAPKETQREAFLRRLSNNDPARPIYEAYVAEFEERWDQAQEVSESQAMALLPEIERKFSLELQEFEVLALSMCDEIATEAKEEGVNIEKMIASDQLTSGLQGGGYLAIFSDGTKASRDSQILDAMNEFDQGKEKFVDVVNSTKMSLDRKTK